MTSRFVNPIIKYTTATLKTMPGAELYFYITGTTTPKVTYQDFNGIIPHTNPVVALSDGHFPPIFLDGTYRAELKYLGVTQPGWPVDDIGATNDPAPLADWNSGFSYSDGDLVTGPDGNRYESLQDNNLNNDPTAPGSLFWSQVFLSGNVDSWQQLDVAARSGSGPKADAESAIRYSIDLPEPTALSYVRGNADGTYTNRTYAETKTDLGVVTGPASSVEDQVALFSGITGKIIKAGDTISNYFNNFLATLYNVFPRSVSTFAALATTAAVVGQIANTKSHTSGIIGAGKFIGVPSAGLVPDGGTISVSATAGVYWQRIDYVSLSPLDFGAAGNGTTNDTAPLNLFFTWLMSLGSPKIGDGKNLTYAVAGPLLYSGFGFRIYRLKLKQLTPGAATIRTLTFNACTDFVAEDITVNMNSTGIEFTTLSDVTAVRGLSFVGCSNFTTRRLEVFGGPVSSGLVFIGSSNFKDYDAYVHDMFFNLASNPGDDRIQGYWIYACSNFDIYSARTINLTGNYGAGPFNRWTRGFTCGNCQYFSLNNMYGENCDQPLDISGSDGNRDFKVIGGSSKNTYSYGLKLANSAYRFVIIGYICHDPGRAGFIFSSQGVAPFEMDGDIIGCRAYDVGSNGNYGGGTVAGFFIEGATAYPDNLRFIDCAAIDNQATKTMKNGFLNETTISLANRANLLINCRVSGASVKSVVGFNTGNRGYVANRYYGGGFINPSNTAPLAITPNTLYAIPFEVTSHNEWAEIDFVVSTLAAGMARVGLYTWENGAPSRLIIDAGAVSVNSTGTKAVGFSPSLYLEPGVYALAIVSDASPSIYCSTATIPAMDAIGLSAVGTTAQIQISSAFAYAPLPANFGAVTYTAANIPNLMMRSA